MAESYDHMAGEEQDVADHPDNVGVYRPGIPSNTGYANAVKETQFGAGIIAAADTQRRNTYKGLVDRQKGR